MVITEGPTESNLRRAEVEQGIATAKLKIENNDNNTQQSWSAKRLGCTAISKRSACSACMQLGRVRQKSAASVLGADLRRRCMFRPEKTRCKKKKSGNMKKRKLKRGGGKRTPRKNQRKEKQRKRRFWQFARVARGSTSIRRRKQ